ncbi:MAG: hypothetical protein APF76_01440 [Desulfitibacter sp. BRH_c19]|nr:MAG: hypothetical protein APF76_01440 [Desulfitibacter sp. BRH_c19]
MRIGTRIFLDKLRGNKEFCCSQFDILEIQDFVFPENLVHGIESLHKEYHGLLKSFNGEITIHGPYMDLNPISMDESIKQLTFERYLQAVEVAKVFGSKWIVIHTYFSQIHNCEPWYQDYWVKENLLFWEKLIPILEREEITIVLENVFDVNPEPLKRMVETLNSKYFKVCLDVGHCNVFSDYSIGTWLNVLGESVRYLHISDNDGIRDNHLAVGKGNIKFKDIARNLQKKEERIIAISEAFCSLKEEKEGLNLLKKGF